MALATASDVPSAAPAEIAPPFDTHWVRRASVARDATLARGGLVLTHSISVGEAQVASRASSSSMRCRLRINRISEPSTSTSGASGREL